jgi:DNA topoisomerase II
LTTKPSHFGSECEVAESVIKRIIQTTEVAPAVLGWARARLNSENERAIKKGEKSGVKNILKLDDANWAGGKKSQECTLIVTEGDSAKALAVSGVS